ncbi:MAG: hypothetical protein SFT81_00360 [Candidatus Caenarcaniphilales bacterium]|nr:hypothetical protein [Candidatus Caenarcaniphilales bacterium]
MSGFIMSKKLFIGKKYILASGRVVDMSCDEEEHGAISVLALFNLQDAVHEVTKPLSLRMEWHKLEDDPIITIECRGGYPGDGRPISESEMPIEGLNGHKEKLKASELLELVEAMTNVHRKVREEISVTTQKGEAV